MITRQLEVPILKKLNQKKAILLFGARQVGKTTLLKSVVAKSGLPALFLNGDEPDIKALLAGYSSAKLKLLFGSNRLVVIDEAQNIPWIGALLKIIVDYIPAVQVIASGSSSFELSNRANEPLTGRKYEFILYPLSFAEMVRHKGYLDEYRIIEHRMVYGYCPEIIISEGQEEPLLRLLSGSYLYKDLLLLEQIKRPKLIEKILRALALQIGSEVSYSEIAQLVGADGVTVEKYIDILEQAFIVFRLPAFSRNVRNEIKKGKKIYFADNGIRNAILGNFLPLHSRSDTGALWENFLVSERRKYLNNMGIATKSWFWRSTQQQEIDYLEEYADGLYAYEFKWNPKASMKFPATFTNAYSPHLQAINRDNFERFLLQSPEEDH